MRVKVNYKCIASYMSYLEMPDDLTYQEQIEWANNHISEAVVEDYEFLEDIEGSAEIVQ